MNHNNVIKQPAHTAGSETKGVKTLMGDPKKAILRLSIPMIIAMSSHTIYNLFDAIWVSGLGADALAAVGFFFPFFFVIIAISTGIGVGGGAAISRRIGAGDKAGADNVAVHTMVIMIIASIIFTIPFFIFAETIFKNTGAGKIIDLVIPYSRILFAGSIITFFSMVVGAVLRSEGDAKRPMYAMVFGALLNIIIDPVFIFGPNHPGPWIFKQYGLDLGIAGAAWATMISMSITSLIIFYWLFIKKDTYVSFHFKKFKWNKSILRDISRVGLPALIMQLSMAITMLITNLVIVWVNSTDGIAVYSAGWRVATIAILPLLGISTAVVSVTGAAFGARDMNKLKTAHMYSIKIGVIIEIIFALATYILAQQIAVVFTLADDAMRIRDDIIVFLRIMCIFYPIAAFGMLSGAMFQGIGKGMISLTTTIIRTIILTTLFMILFGKYLDMGLVGVWYGIVIANTSGSVIAFTWAKVHIKGLSTVFQKFK